MREDLDAAIVSVGAVALFSMLLLVVRIKRPFDPSQATSSRFREIALLSMLAGLLAAMATGQLLASAMSALALGTLFSAAAWLLPRLSAPGTVMTAMPVAALAAAGPWGYLWLRELGYPGWSLTMYLVGLAVGALFMPYRMFVQFAQNALITHRSWRRPSAPIGRGSHTPRVSIHLPCHSEPPDVVIKTLNALANLDYDDFEVIVCDNNTVDPQLWRPLGHHCAALNQACGVERFRFFHVEGLEGAKAGALNYCLGKTARDVDLVALVDADYVAEPDFLARLVGFFDDPAVGFVQSSHDYMEFEGSTFKSMCYREYMPNYKFAMASANEYHGAFTIGTMCLFRRDALELAGGWAEWCLTEDSEIAVRLRAVGYDGVYLRDTFGRGLIPDTFDDYKKQRFRWTAGPVQQLRRHWRLYLPSWMPGGRAGMRPWAKLLEFQHSLSEIAVLGIPLAILALPLFGALVVGGALPPLIVPSAAWLVMGMGLVTTILSLVLTSRLSDQTTPAQVIGGVVARQALLLVRIQAAFAGLIASRPLAWRRTPKFGAGSGSFGRIVTSSWMKTMLGGLLLGCAALPWLCAEELGEHLSLLGSLGFLLLGLRFLCAPLLAAMREVEIRYGERPTDSNLPADSRLIPAHRLAQGPITSSSSCASKA
jgi:cellulose synthase/poly-beta-1,6-N-acetylglucosamine synthase-like glycosyltransferase